MSVHIPSILFIFLSSVIFKHNAKSVHPSQGLKSGIYEGPKVSDEILAGEVLCPQSVLCRCRYVVRCAGALLQSLGARHNGGSCQYEL